jgi:hypothetical protein
MTGALVLAGLGATVGVIGKALGLFGGKKADSMQKMVPVLNAMGSVSEQQFIAAQSAFKNMKESINKTKPERLDSMKSMIQATAILAASPVGLMMAPAIASTLAGSTAAPTPPSVGAASTSSTQKLSLSVDVPIVLEIGGDRFKKHVLNLVKRADSNTMTAALNKRAPAPD